MPASVLWAVDLFGRVYTLSTAGQYWELCKDVQMEFKRVSAATQCCWGIACDNQVYLYVCPSDVPIRHREEAYENQVVLVGVGLLRWSAPLQLVPETTSVSPGLSVGTPWEASARSSCRVTAGRGVT